VVGQLGTTNLDSQVLLSNTLLLLFFDPSLGLSGSLFGNTGVTFEFGLIRGCVDRF
jgi:hypothetical protein